MKRGFTDDNVQELLSGIPAVVCFVGFVVAAFRNSSNTGHWFLASIFFLGFALGKSFQRPKWHCGIWCKQCSRGATEAKP